MSTSEDTLLDLESDDPVDALTSQCSTVAVGLAALAEAVDRGLPADLTLLRETLEELERGVEAFLRRTAAAAQEQDPGGRCPITHLPRRTAALRLLEALAASSHPIMACVVSLERAGVFRARYGRDLYCEILANYARHLQSNLRPPSRLYHWGEAVFVILFDPSQDPELFRRDAFRAATQRLMRTVASGRRTVVVSLTGSCTFIEGSPLDDYEAVLSALEAETEKATRRTFG